jgi:AraC-like DNA-binding protein
MGHLLTIAPPTAPAERERRFLSKLRDLSVTELESTLPVHYLRHIAEQIRRSGGDVTDWLGRSGLRESQLSDATLTIPYPVFEQLVVDALAVSREPALGLLVGERLLANTHGMLGYAALNSDTIRQALELLERYVPLRTSLITISHEIHAGEARARFHTTQPLGELQRPVLEAVVLSIKNVLDTITMGSCQVGMVAFPFAAPEYAVFARDLFSCEVRYDQQWAGFTVPVEALDVPLKLADPEAFLEASRICQRELDKLTANVSLAARVRRHLLEKQNGFPSLQVVARLVHMTPRTLHRRLLDEGTSFRELLENVRHTLAIEHVKAQRFSIEEIAYMLGYSDLANFRRAFKRWESIPPAEYRNQHTQAPRKREEVFHGEHAKSRSDHR